MKSFYRWVLCVGLAAFCGGVLGCADETGEEGVVDVEVNEVPDLDPQTDDDVDVDIGNDAEAVEADAEVGEIE